MDELIEALVDAYGIKCVLAHQTHIVSMTSRGGSILVFHAGSNGDFILYSHSGSINFDTVGQVLDYLRVIDVVES